MTSRGDADNMRFSSNQHTIKPTPDRAIIEPSDAVPSERGDP